MGRVEIALERCLVAIVAGRVAYIFSAGHGPSGWRFQKLASHRRYCGQKQSHRGYPFSSRSHRWVVCGAA
jgi:hypothetical protein